MKFKSAIVVAALIASSACYVFGVFHQTPDRIYTGIRSLNASDYNTHLSWIDQSRHGRFLMKNKFTAEPQTGYFVRPVYYLLSQPFRITNLPNAVVFHILRIFCGLLLLIVLFKLFRAYRIDSPAAARAFLLLVFTAGAGVLVHRWTSSIDLDLPEAFVFLSLGEAPHFLYSLLFLWAGIASIYAGKPAIYFFCLLLLWWEHPFEAVILICVSVANLWIVKDRKKQIGILIVTAGVSIPPYLYYQHLKNTPAFSGWGSAQNLMLSPGIPAVILGYLPLLLLAIAGFFHLRHQEGGKQLLRFLLIWIAVQFVLMYLPFPFQRRLIAGLQFPLALLAAYGIRNVKNIALAALILVLSATNAWNVAHWIQELKPHQMPYYMSRDYHDAFRWLSKQNDPDAVVLSGFVTGNFIPGFSGLTAYMGHSSLTPGIAKKKEAALAFYQNPSMSFLIKNRIQFIFWGLEEKHGSTTAVGSLFEVAYKNAEVMILLPRPTANERAIADLIPFLERMRRRM